MSAISPRSTADGSWRPSCRAVSRPRRSRCSAAASTYPVRPSSGALFLERGPQPFLEVELRFEDPFHEQDDLALRIQAVPRAVLAETAEDLRVDADVVLHLGLPPHPGRLHRHDP